MKPADAHQWGEGIRKMFDRIAPRYDLMNRLMTAGQDRVWRRAVVRAANLPMGGRLLDVGTGTGAIARDAVDDQPTILAVGCDFSEEMMHVGRRQPAGSSIFWCRADGHRLPFATEQFDAVVSGYLLRNVHDLDMALTEQVRVLKPGGRLVSLDTSPPPTESALTPLVNLGLKWFIPLLGQLIAGDRKAYTYLPDSTKEFLTPEALADRFRRAGLNHVRHQPFMFNTIAVHVGIKPV